ncbi:sigma-70 family RNA polymerase sigma factor [Pusillimonas sp. CC-YST705]|uniref:Sigma-70 family RNA polymerase sigma factor n=1 Tax=Mesopusillimonas faecipullorum TaxID=2755040 RepID=A0ABS8C828_9BURK|nr:sigma-70 family RNA polymerase sigma factor [Mesopusillimonas faecipullorum]MCB5362175.1 sigma-70 family RNA polymerase sigma factor [Mesopusillimonas faecipullorum]
MLEHYYRELLNFCARSTRDPDTAADTVQETYLRVLSAQQRGDAIAEPRALLYRTAKNLMVDQHRRATVRGQGCELEDDNPDTPAASLYEPETAAMSNQAVQALLEVIGAMPPRRREAFILHRFEGLSHAEIASRMGMTQKMVEQHISAAVKDCRRGRQEWDRRLVLSALAGLAVLGAGRVLWTQRELPHVQHLATSTGEARQFVLADGSELYLDTATVLQAELYADRREIVLDEGQVLFSVSHDAQRPFEVVAGGFRITVLGTRFSVRHTPASPGYPGVSVAVESGQVQVEPMSARSWRTFWRAPQAIRLQTGQQLTMATNNWPGELSKIAPEQIAPWREGRISFHDQTLAGITAEFSRYGHAPAYIPDPKVAALKLTGTFDLQDPATLYRLLPRALPVHVSSEQGRVRIDALPAAPR